MKFSNMKVFLFIAAFTLYYTSLYSQRGANCGMLTALLNNKEVDKVFHLALNRSVPIIFVDPKQIFKDCQIDSAYGRTVKIVHDSSYVSIVDDSNIIIKSLVQKGKKYQLELYHKIMQAYGYVEFTRKRGQYKVSEVMMGNY